MARVDFSRRAVASSYVPAQVQIGLWVCARSNLGDFRQAVDKSCCKALFHGSNKLGPNTKGWVPTQTYGAYMIWPLRDRLV